MVLDCSKRLVLEVLISDAGWTVLDCRTMAGFIHQVFGAANLLFQPVLLLPFCSLWATCQEALFQAPFCNPFYFVFAVLGWLGGFWILKGMTGASGI